MSVLERILTYKRDEVAARKAVAPWRDLTARARDNGATRGFKDRLEFCVGRPALIAEVKKASPSKGLIREQFDPPTLARAYEAGGAACLSILTDEPSFQGSDDYLIAARAACTLPVLRKDFMIDPWQVAESRAIGADAILIILAAVDDSCAAELADAATTFGMDALVEVHDLQEMDRACRLNATLVGINNRSLVTFETSLTLTEQLAPHRPPDALLVSESGIHTHADILRLQRAEASAFLVGESLMRQADVEAATKDLLGIKRAQ